MDAATALKSSLLVIKESGTSSKSIACMGDSNRCLLKLFINGYKRCHNTDTPLPMTETLFSTIYNNFRSHMP